MYFQIIYINMGNLCIAFNKYMVFFLQNVHIYYFNIDIYHCM